MHKIQQNPYINKPDNLVKIPDLATGDMLHRLAFDNSLQANIITIADSGKIIIANAAARKLLRYSKKEILTKTKSAIFDINERSFQKMLKQRTTEGHSRALVTAIQKSGRSLPCEITSAVFMDKDGIEKAITTIVDMSESVFKQKNIDKKKETTVANNIVLAKSRQQKIDAKKEKLVAYNITRALEKSDAKLVENNEWIKYIAKTSYDVMWDWDIASEEIYVGDSLEEVFGYTVQNNTVKLSDFMQCLVPGETARVEKKLMQTIASGSKGWKDSYMLKRNDGSLASTTSRASIIRDEEGKALRLIGAIQDVSRLQELEKKLEDQINSNSENTEIIHLAAKLSYDGIWDWNIMTNELFLGEGFEELFGYVIKKNKRKMADWSRYLHPDDKEAFEKGLQEVIASPASHYEHAYRFINADGSVADVFARATIIRDAGGNASRMIGTIHDLTNEKKLEKKLNNEIATTGKLLSESKKSFELIFNSSPDILLDCDLLTNEVVISDAFEKEFGYKITSKMTPELDWLSHIHKDDINAVLKDYYRMLASDDLEWKYSYRYYKADGSVANISSSGIIIRDTDSIACRMVVFMHDISKQKVLEERLEQEIKLKERQIAEAMEEAKDSERSDIGKELHDNINQLLGASRLYVDLAKRGGENSEMYLKRSSEYTLTAIEEIRKLTKGLTSDIVKSLGLSEAIHIVSRDTMEIYPAKITFSKELFIENSVNEKFKINVFRIVQEQLNNIIKHSKATEIVITLSQKNNSIVLFISDNGVGFDTRKKRKGIGMDNIKSRALHYNGTARFVSQPGEGCVLTVKFPVKDTLLKDGEYQQQRFKNDNFHSVEIT